MMVYRKLIIGIWHIMNQKIYTCLVNTRLFLIIHLYLTELMKTLQNQFLNFRLVKMQVIHKWVETTHLGGINQGRLLAGFLYLQVFTIIMFHIIQLTHVWTLLIFLIIPKDAEAVMMRAILIVHIRPIHQEVVLEMHIHIYLNMLKKTDPTQTNLIAKI